MNTHLCPGCHDIEVDPSMLACRECWYQLPPELRNRIWRAYRNRAASPGTHTAAIAEALRWYDQQAAAASKES